MGSHAEGGFTRADGPISHVEGVKATTELSDYQSFVWQGTDVMPNELTDITPSTWDEYKAHGPGTFNINPAKGLNGVYISETSLYDLVKDDHLTIIEFDNGEARVFDWSGDITQATMTIAGLYDNSEGSWILKPVYVRIGNRVTSIGMAAFEDCNELTSITIPNSVTSIGEDAFYGCSGLSSVTIPNSVTSIRARAFVDCTSLTNITIPDSVTSIGDSAFDTCTSLIGIVIGKNVAVVDNYAFSNCTSLSNDSNLSSITIDKGNWEKLFNDVDFEYYRSNKISDNESTSMSVSIEASESFPVTIKLKTSSEEGCDTLTLTLDGQELTSMSGITDWQYLPATIPSGSHTVVLTYGKDGSVSKGDDNAYFAIVQGCIAVMGKTQEEAEQLLANANAPETCRIITIKDSGASTSEKADLLPFAQTIEDSIEGEPERHMWSEDVEYYTGDTVAYEGRFYTCNQNADSGHPPTDTDYWTEIPYSFYAQYNGFSMMDVTWEMLVGMRDGGLLFPGVKYRITDYVTTVDQEDCRSAGHPFDLIVTAIDHHTLDENARATIHDGDNYFAAREFHIPDYQQYLEYARVPLEAWEIKYCLDNDKTRFKFADTENGKGVIYWMKDEFGNEAPYDFKNMQFKRYEITLSPGATNLEGVYGLATTDI